MKHARLLVFLTLCLAAAAWAFLLIGKHYDAEALLLEPGLLCQDGGCSAVLASDYSAVLGIPVSVPAVPLYLALAMFALLALRGRLEREQLCGLAVLSGLGGMAFGGYLLWAMLVQVGEVCRYCLIMDGLNLLVLGAGAALHPGGLGAGLRAAPRALPILARPFPGLALFACVLLGTVALHELTQRDVVEPSVPTPAEATPTPPSAGPASTAVAGQPAAPGTRRVVLTEDVKTIALDPSVPVRGRADAPVTIVLFEDFQCPFCKKLSGNVELLLEEIPDQIRVAFMHFPMQQSCNEVTLAKSMHHNACSAAAASVCAQEQGKFWEMHDLLFRNNNQLGGRALLGYAKELGLDTARWRTCFEAPSTVAKIKRDSKVGGDAGVTGTPSFFIGGRRLVGAQPVEALKAAVAAVQAQPTGRVLLDVEVVGEVIGEVAAAAAAVSMVGPDGAFSIDAFEASLEGGKARSVPGVAPARSTTWFEADAACKAAGKRLCSEAEWITACSGVVPVDADQDGIFSKDALRGRQHSYGEHYRQGWCADGRKKGEGADLLTGNHPRCATPDGVYDLEGVMKEWVGATPDRAALKGGSYYSGDSARCAYFKDGEAPDTEDESIGFRCCSGGAESKSSVERYPGGKVGDAILAWERPKQGGGQLPGKELQGKPYIMTFWASWCAPCKKELPALAALYASHQGQGLQIVAVNVDRDRAAADRYLAESPLPFPVVYDTDNSMMDRFDTRGVPTTFWVERDGRIRQRTVGYDESGQAKLLEDADALIGR